MKTVLAYTTTQTFQLKVDAATIKRLYEDSNTDYTFASSDVEFNLTDAQDVYDLVTTGEEVFIVVKDGDITKFYGTFQEEGAAYDPETEVYTITALHISKKIFNELATVFLPSGYPTSMSLGIARLFKVWTQFSEFVVDENVYPLNVYIPVESSVSTTVKYSMRDWVIDLAKHHKAIVHVGDDLTTEGRSQIFFESKVIAESIVHHGYDNLIASYKEDSRNPQFEGVVFPCYVNIISALGTLLPHSAYAFYSRDGVKLLLCDTVEIAPYTVGGISLQHIKVGDDVTVPDNYLDMRVPADVYGSTMPKALPYGYLPTFVCVPMQSTWWASPLNYCDTNFRRLVYPFMEITVGYSQMLPVNPAETLVVRGMNLPLAEVDDDIVDESTTVIGRLYA